MEETPACRECKRTHTREGSPVLLRVKGENAGLCAACVWARVGRTEPLPRPGVEDNTRTLEFYITRRRERIARHQRHVNTPRKAYRCLNDQ